MPSRSWSFGEWLAYRLEHIVKPDREHNTYVKYESKVRLYLVPHLGKKPMVTLSPAQIRTCMAALTREKVPAATRFEVPRTLRTARAHRFYAACVLVLVLGLRRSEVLGLRCSFRSSAPVP